VSEERVVGEIALRHPVYQEPEHPIAVRLVRRNTPLADQNDEVMRFVWADGRTIDIPAISIAVTADCLGRRTDTGHPDNIPRSWP
jgi:hypothetical protein